MSDPADKPPIFEPAPASGQNPKFIDAMIPAKNADALIAYYLGLFAILPLLGTVLGVVALIKGKSGLRMAREMPEHAGATHARVGIGCGAIGLLFNLLIVAFVIALLLHPGK